jgi:DNA-binding MarR family transcriptional regulator
MDGSLMAQSIDLDETIHQKTRLMIMAHLAAVDESDFLEMKRTLGLSDGNLSVHTSILEKNGFIESEKTFVGKKTKTVYRITIAGCEAFEKYIASLESILRGVVG